MRVLIIEDELSIAELERDYLQVNGFDCDLAVDGEEGLQMARKNDYALVIIDIMLPKRDGFSVCTELRKEKDIPIIFLSARSEDIDKVRGLGLGRTIISPNRSPRPNWWRGSKPMSADTSGWCRQMRSRAPA